MFTGIIEAVGVIRDIKREKEKARMLILLNGEAPTTEAIQAEKKRLKTLDASSKAKQKQATESNKLQQLHAKLLAEREP